MLTVKTSLALRIPTTGGWLLAVHLRLWPSLCIQLLWTRLTAGSLEDCGPYLYPQHHASCIYLIDTHIHTEIDRESERVSDTRTHTHTHTPLHAFTVITNNVCTLTATITFSLTKKQFVALIAWQLCFSGAVLSRSSQEIDLVRGQGNLVDNDLGLIFCGALGSVIFAVSGMF